MPPGAISIYVKSDEVWDLQTSYVEYSTSFQSGLTINTQNSTALSSFPPLKECEKTIGFQRFADHRQLYQVHETLLSRHHASTKVMRLDQEFDGDAVAFVRAVLSREMVGASNDGYLYLTSDSKHFRATVKGALLMTWQELFPLQANSSCVTRPPGPAAVGRTGVFADLSLRAITNQFSTLSMYLSDRKYMSERVVMPLVRITMLSVRDVYNPRPTTPDDIGLLRGHGTTGREK